MTKRMSKKDAGRLLIIIGDFTNYQPSQSAADHWAEALEGFDYEESRLALVEHFRRSEFVPKPAEVIRILKELRGNEPDTGISDAEAEKIMKELGIR
ncbi:hypothetical protein ACFSR7_36350 [Cohnella sp. GCM10020058]|uniref:hypothetical protein n=1 Tax=Cohnella sp. GCM10020058 TaxID=3317330 RepID=UPI00363BF7B9